MTDEFYEPKELRIVKDKQGNEYWRITLSQMIWLIKNWVTLWEGTWPSNPIGSGYVDIAQVKGKRPGKAPFISPCEVAAEIDIRLKKCGIDGQLVKPYYCLGESLEQLAKLAHCYPWQVEGRILRVLNYVSGKWPKDRSYAEFRRH